MRELREIQLAPKGRAAIERAAGILRKQSPVERGMLFGSKARGDDPPDSDIDRLILTKENLNRHREQAVPDALFEVQMELGVMPPYCVPARPFSCSRSHATVCFTPCS